MSQKLRPNFTPVPNVIFDEALRTLPLGAAKVLFAICRYTYGWGKPNGDRISLSQLQEMTGMARGSVARSVKGLGPLVTVTQGDPSRQTASEYRINVEISETELVSLRDQGLVSKSDQASLSASRIKRPSKENQRNKNVARTARVRNRKSDSRVNGLLNFWQERYQERTGAPYVVDYAKDGALLKALLASFSEADIQAVMRRFLDSNDDWIRTTGGYTIGVFRSQFNKLISTKPKANGPVREMPV
jgi:hypothetical protein